MKLKWIRYWYSQYTVTWPPCGASLLYISQYGYPGEETEHFLRLSFMGDVNRIAISLMTVYNSTSTFTNFFPLSSKGYFPICALSKITIFNYLNSSAIIRPIRWSNQSIFDLFSHLKRVEVACSHNSKIMLNAKCFYYIGMESSKMF